MFIYINLICSLDVQLTLKLKDKIWVLIQSILTSSNQTKPNLTQPNLTYLECIHVNLK